MEIEESPDACCDQTYKHKTAVEVQTRALPLDLLGFSGQIRQPEVGKHIKCCKIIISVTFPMKHGYILIERKQCSL